MFSLHWLLKTKAFYILGLIFLIIVIFNLGLGSATLYQRLGKNAQVTDEEEAVSLFSKSLKINPLDHATYFLRGLIYLSWGKDWLSTAQDDFQSARILAPREAKYYYYLGLCEERKQHYSRAIKFYTDALSYDFKNVLFLFSRGKLYYAQQEIPKAFNDFRKIVLFDCRIYNTILTFFQNKPVDLDLLESITPDTLSTSLKFGNFLLERKEYDRALSYLSPILQLRQIKHYDLYKLGIMLNKYGQSQAAVPYIAKIFQLGLTPADSRYIQYLKLYTSLLHRTGQQEKLFQFLEVQIEEFPAVPEQWVTFAGLYVHSDGIEKQVEILRKGLSYNKGSALLNYHLGLAYKRQAKYLEAFRFLEQAYRTERKNFSYIYQLARLYFERGMYLKSRILCEELLEIKPQNIAAFELLQKIYQTLQLHEEEKKVLQKIITVKPDHPIAQKRLVDLN